MPNFSSPKDLLLHYGKIEKIGRGRISESNHAFIAERIAAGDKVGGYEAKVSTKPNGEKKHSNATAPVSGDKTIADIGNPSRDESEIQAYRYEDGKKVPVGMRTACNLCRCSLTYCFCPSPQIWVDSDRCDVVRFERRTTPFKKGW